MQSIQFPNTGFVRTSVDANSIRNLTQEIEDMDRSRQPTIDHSHVGVITNEFRIVTESARNELAQVLMPACEQFAQSFHWTAEQRPMTLTDTWVNFQRPGEYFIPHTHKGVFSFALWIRVPFTQAEEASWRESNGKSSRALHAFTFHYTDALGRITPYELPVDRTWERECVVFLGETMHSVTPFYSTDEERIVVSGNVEYV